MPRDAVTFAFGTNSYHCVHIHGGRVRDACVKNAMLSELVCPKPHPPAGDCPGEKGKSPGGSSSSMLLLVLELSLHISLPMGLQADFCKK